MQLDIKYVPYPILGKQLYQVSAIDHHSSWRFIRSFEDRTEQTIVGFLTELEAACPFAIFLSNFPLCVPPDFLHGVPPDFQQCVPPDFQGKCTS
jgi:hypothetical protein